MDSASMRRLVLPGESLTLTFALDEYGRKVDGSDYEIRRPTRGDMREIRKEAAEETARVVREAQDALDAQDGVVIEAVAHLRRTLVRAPARWYTEVDGKRALDFDGLDEREIRAVWTAARDFFLTAIRYPPAPSPSSPANPGA